MQQRRRDLAHEYRHLSWLELNGADGQEYWEAMQLMGDYAAANHAVIHKLVTNHLGAHIIAGVENHHNFAWEEEHFGKKVIVTAKVQHPLVKAYLVSFPAQCPHPHSS